MSIELTNGDFLQVRNEFRLGSDVAYNIHHFKVTGLIVTSSGLPPAVPPAFGTMADGIGEKLYQLWAAGWTTLASSQVEYTGVTVQDIYPAPRSRPFTYVPAVIETGLKAGDALPLQDSATILKQTAYGQRWGIGRTFVVGLPESAQNSGKLNAGAIADLEALADQYLGPITFPVGLYTVTLRWYLFKDFGLGGIRSSQIDTAQLSNDVLKTQRRRRPGKGI